MGNNGLISIFVLSLMLAGCGNSPDTAGNTQNTNPEMTDAEKIAADTNALGITFSGGDTSSSVTGNLTLPTNGPNGSTITWSSDTPSVVADNGSVTRPAYNTGDATVVLTATISSGTATPQTLTYTLTILETPPTDAEAIAADVSTLSIVYTGSDTLNSVTADLGLSTTGPSGTTISWSSDTPGVIANNGVVTRPAFGSGNATVTVIATVSKGGATPQSVTYVFTVIENILKKIIYLTNASVHPITSVANADNACMTDANYPGTGVYKALLVDNGTSRTACTSANCATGGNTEHKNWVLIPNATYVRPDGTTEIFKANANGIFVFGNFTNPITTVMNRDYWTGINSDWTTGVTCSNWTSVSGAVNGLVLNPLATGWLSGGTLTCDWAGGVACVEQ